MIQDVEHILNSQIMKIPEFIREKIARYYEEIEQKKTDEEYYHLHNLDDPLIDGYTEDGTDDFNIYANRDDTTEEHRLNRWK